MRRTRLLLGAALLCLAYITFLQTFRWSAYQWQREQLLSQLLSKVNTVTQERDVLKVHSADLRLQLALLRAQVKELLERNPGISLPPRVTVQLVESSISEADFEVKQLESLQRLQAVARVVQAGGSALLEELKRVQNAQGLKVGSEGSRLVGEVLENSRELVAILQERVLAAREGGVLQNVTPGLHQRLASEVQRRMQVLQYPKECDSTKFLLCDVSKPCGFGCQLHQVAFCFSVAYGSNRTLGILNKTWNYTPAGWTSEHSLVICGLNDDLKIFAMH